MSMIGLDAMEAIMEATESLYGVSARDMVKVFRHLDDNGWQLTRKPEPVVEPVPDPPVAAMVIAPERWLPAHVSALWTEGVDGSAIPVLDEQDLRNKRSARLTFFEATTKGEAERLFANPDSMTIGYFQINGEAYEYRFDEIPF